MGSNKRAIIAFLIIFGFTAHAVWEYSPAEIAMRNMIHFGLFCAFIIVALGLVRRMVLKELEKQGKKVNQEK